MRAGTKQLETGLIADLHAPAGEQRDASAKICQLSALAEIQLGARRAHLIVEVMDLCVFLFADVAVLEFFSHGPAEAGPYRRGRSLCLRFAVDVLLFEVLRWKH